MHCWYCSFALSHRCDIAVNEKIIQFIDNDMKFNSPCAPTNTQPISFELMPQEYGAVVIRYVIDWKFSTTCVTLSAWKLVLISLHFGLGICWCLSLDPCWSHSSVTYAWDIMPWKHFPHYCPFLWGIHQPVVDSPHKGPVMQGSFCVCN